MGIDTNSKPVDPNTLTVPPTGAKAADGSLKSAGETIANLIIGLTGVHGKGNVTKTSVDALEAVDVKAQFNKDGSLSVSFGIADPKVPKTNDSLIETYIATLVLEKSDGKVDPNKKLVVGLSNGIEGIKAGLSIAAAGDAGKSQTCAFLGGLVMVALSDILASFAKLESQIKKMSSVLFLSSQAMMKDLAECIAKNTEDKARSQAESKILQAVVTAVATTLQFVAVLGSLHQLRKRPDVGADGIPKTTTEPTGKMKPKTVDNKPVYTDKQVKHPDGSLAFEQKTNAQGELLYNKPKPNHPDQFEEVTAKGVSPDGFPVDSDGVRLDSPVRQPQMVPEMEPETRTVPALREANQAETQKATIMGQFGTMANQLGSATSNLIDARSILEVGHLEASNIRLQFMQDQMGKMQDTYSKMGNDADQKVGEIWDLLKNMFSGLFQAFRSLTGK